MEKKDHIDLIYSELGATRELSNAKVGLAWRELILSLAIPVSAGAIDLANVDFLNTRFVMLAASLIGAAVMAYAFYLYLEVAHLLKYCRSLEFELNALAGVRIATWETEYTPWSNQQLGVPAIFMCFLLSMLVVIVLSVVHATTGFFLDADEKNPTLEWTIVGPCIAAFCALTVAVVSFVNGILSAAGPPKEPGSRLIDLD